MVGVDQQGVYTGETKKTLTQGEQEFARAAKLKKEYEDMVEDRTDEGLGELKEVVNGDFDSNVEFTKNKKCIQL
jgi:hypothetical protein